MKAPMSNKTAEVVEELVTDTPKAPRAPQPAFDQPYDRTPSNWSVMPTAEEGIIEARNEISGLIFTGTVAELNAIIRG